MELTKKDLRHIKEQVAKDIWRIQAQASEYAHLYKMEFLRQAKQEIEARMDIEDTVYNKQANI